MAAKPGTGAAAPLCALLARLGLLPENCPPGEMPLRLVLAVADERERYVRRILAARHEGYTAGREAGWHNGYQQGYDASEADHIAEWQTIKRQLTEPGPLLNPDGYKRHLAAQAERNIRRAATAEEHDHAEHEREFVARAYATPDHLRSDAQRATVHAYPPPAGAQVVSLDRARRGRRVARG